MKNDKKLEFILKKTFKIDGSILDEERYRLHINNKNTFATLKISSQSSSGFSGYGLHLI